MRCPRLARSDRRTDARRSHGDPRRAAGAGTRACVHASPYGGEAPPRHVHPCSQLGRRVDAVAPVRSRPRPPRTAVAPPKAAAPRPAPSTPTPRPTPAPAPAPAPAPTPAPARVPRHPHPRPPLPAEPIAPTPEPPVQALVAEVEENGGRKKPKKPWHQAAAAATSILVELTGADPLLSPRRPGRAGL